MKRGGFWMTTVAAGVAVLGLMTVGRAGLKSQAVLFLQGQMKIAAGDTDSGLKLLAEASSRPQMGASLTNPLDTANQPVKAAEPKKPCKNWSISGPQSVPRRSVSRTEPVAMKLTPLPAPEPTLASFVPTVPAPPMVPSAYAQDAMAYIPTAQREAIRARQAEVKREQCIREQEIKKAFREVSYRYQLNSVPSAREIQIQVEKGLGTLAQ